MPFNLTDEPYSFRRTIYGFIDRVKISELLLQFDFNNPRIPFSKRDTTIVPQQALFFMNDPMVVDVSQKIVARPEVAAQTDEAERIVVLYRIIYQRDPTAEELRLGREYLAAIRSQLPELTKDFAPRPPTPKPVTRRQRKDPQPGTNEGHAVERRLLTDWELYAQALLFANEVAFVK